VVDPRRSRGGDRRLGVVGDAETGVPDHVEVVGAVADRERVDVVEIEGFGELDQGCEFCGAAQNRLDHFAGEPAVLDLQLVSAVLVKAEHRGDRGGEQGKAAGDQAGVGAMGAHGRDQFAPARRRRDAFCQNFVDHADG